jgi:hypothetical protein
VNRRQIPVGTRGIKQRCNKPLSSARLISSIGGCTRSIREVPVAAADVDVAILFRLRVK